MKKYIPKDDKVCQIIKKKYAERKDKDNLYGVGITDGEFVDFIIYELLGEDWYVVDPLGHNQINEIAFYKIMEKYQPKKWKLLSKEDINV